MTDKQLKKIETSKKVKFCYIKKHGVFYSENHCGYTDDRTKAGVYTKEVALKSVTSCRELAIIPIDIDAHNNAIMEKVKDLCTRLINEKS